MKLAQTKALFVDAYRELNAKKMFWLVLLLSGLVVAVFGGVGINERGIQLLFWTLELEEFSTKTMTKEYFYKALFVVWGIGLWLTWIASILALVSTSGMIPDFVSGGSIELTLSKPIGRARVFLTKYVMGLLFVALQVTVFSTACVLLFGVRGGFWEPRILLAVPIVVAFYSYLYCVCALVGLLSKSGLTAVLVTILFWFIVFLFNAGDQSLLGWIKREEVSVSMREARVAAIDAQIADLRERQAADPTEDGRASLQTRIDRRTSQREEEAAAVHSARGTLDKLRPWHTGIMVAKTILPKTGETTALLQRSLMTQDEEEDRIDAMHAGKNDRSGLPTSSEPDAVPPVDDRELDRRMAQATQTALRERSLWWIIGTSLLFEAAVLGIATMLFVRRDF